ncbi:unnamed protein product [Lactuca saligna]|uniref:Uncharacterized protein n=1 Tax=Lactuca saligna TaxID=75948 RepID=A0AA35ZNE9_LACSI|nr:unnamed protein product [Lactuca saligna]
MFFRLENSIQQGGIPIGSSVAPSLLEGLQVLEYVGKETVDLLIAESGMEVDKNGGEGGHGTEDDQLLEEVTFDRCFYIYGGPEHLKRSTFFHHFYNPLDMTWFI